MPGFAGASLWGGAAATPTTSSAMGSFGSFAIAPPAIGDKRFGSSRESRLAHLIPKDSSENMAAKAGPDSAGPESRASWRSRPRTDTDPFAADDGPSGSAALRGTQDASPPPPVARPSHHHHSHPYDTTTTITTTPAKDPSTADFALSGLRLGSRADDALANSSPETNPYGSPSLDRGDDEHVHSLAVGLRARV